MSRFRIVVETHETTNKVILICTPDMKETMLEVFSEVFEVELLGALIEDKENEVLISFDTKNKEKVDFLKHSMKKTFRTGSGLDKINLN